ncbi:hypothetical protein LSH36_3007g00004 [Paralvinella palmiformis]|uniref:Uncharacterized protein n=2 Tax=Paralvinella palmiformis TaxID=53620 RepID=A0AAD9INX5_9ANNE|nr:hypothetical protein LSH36_3007g00004 [Paralvinella palmiformis]
MAATSTEKRRPDSSTFGSSSAIVVDPSTKCESSSEISRTNGCLSVKVDGCWAWVVSLAAFLIMMFVDGISFTYGIISKEFSRYFHLEDNVAKGTLPGAVLLGFYMMADKQPFVRLISLDDSHFVEGSTTIAELLPNVDESGRRFSVDVAAISRRVSSVYLVDGRVVCCPLQITNRGVLFWVQTSALRPPTFT